MADDQIPPWIRQRKAQQPQWQQSGAPAPSQTSQQYPQQPYPQQYPQQQPQQWQQPQSLPPMRAPPMPPQAQKPTQKMLPSQKKKKILYVLLSLLVMTAIATIVTGVYFYLTYVR